MKKIKRRIKVTGTPANSNETTVGRPRSSFIDYEAERDRANDNARMETLGAMIGTLFRILIVNPFHVIYWLIKFLIYVVVTVAKNITDFITVVALATSIAVILWIWYLLSAKM